MSHNNWSSSEAYLLSICTNHVSGCMFVCMSLLIFSRLTAFVEMLQFGWFVRSKGDRCISYRLHSCMFLFVFESVTLEEKHRFKFGGVISGILYHLERFITA